MTNSNDGPPSAVRRPSRNKETPHDVSRFTRTQWRSDPDAAIAHPWRAPRVHDPRRKLSALHRRAERAHRCHRACRLPPGKWRGLYGRGLRQADRRARHLLRDARPGRHQRQHRRAHRLPGLHADDPVRGPGGQ
ncbi:hypothetical protein G6F31_017258 [Rhizopus arrhizus]|nr:hypothetical protein G6F31_017258 [Rhizopus arrhizus]